MRYPAACDSRKSVFISRTKKNRGGGDRDRGQKGKENTNKNKRRTNKKKEELGQREGIKSGKSHRSQTKQEEPGVRRSTQQRKIRKKITISFTFPQHHPQEPEAAEQGIGNKKREEEKVKEARNQQTKLSITIGFSFPSTRGEKGKKLEEQ
jgi:hypothetical protein